MGQPGREAPPPLQLLLVLAERFAVGLLVRGPQPAPQGLTQRPDLGPVTQQGWRDQTGFRINFNTNL